MERTVYKYNIQVCGIDVPTKPDRIEFSKEFEDLLNYLISLPKEDRRKEITKYL